MNVLTYIVAGEEDEMLDIAHSPQPLEEWSGVPVHGLDTAKVVMLHCLLTGDEFDFSVGRYEPVYAPADEGALLLRMADEVMEKLLVLDEEALVEVGEELAATEEFEESGWDADQVGNLMFDIAELARLADSQGQVLFIWMRPEGERRVDE